MQFHVENNFSQATIISCKGLNGEYSFKLIRLNRKNEKSLLNLNSTGL